MAKVNVRKESGCLYLDFRYRGVRCREQTLLADTQANRARLEKLGDKIERAIRDGRFAYADFFPESRRAKAFENGNDRGRDESTSPNDGSVTRLQSIAATPTLSEFAELWLLENEPRWRKHHKEAMRQTLDRIVLPHFVGKHLAEIDRASLLAFQAGIAKRQGRAGQTLSAKRINKLMALVKTILNEGCDRYGLISPAKTMKRLKQKRSEIHPFSLEDVNQLIATVRADYKSYLTVRLLTGLRTGEADGLQWGDIDFVANTLRVERTVSRNGDGDTKTEGSKRTIPLVPQVRDALLAQQECRLPDYPWVFHGRQGNTIDMVNFTNRVWYPLLRHMGLKLRPPYQMRHTAATLMLASGENPEWVASILGHSTTEMLFRVYSRFVPNLTRNDGRAFAGLLNSRIAETAPNPASESPDLSKLTRAQLEAMVRASGTASKEDSHVS